MIHHVQLLSPPGSEGLSREFFVGVLEMEEIPKPPVLAARGGCWFRGNARSMDGIELHVSIDGSFAPADKAHPGLLVADLDTIAERLRVAGYPVAYDEDFPGMRRFYTSDPHRNRLEFLTPEPRV